MAEMKDIIAVRVDSSEQIGTGHLMRCLTLAERMKKDSAEIHFICCDLPGSLHHLVFEQGFSLHLLPRHKADMQLMNYAAWLTVPQTVDAEETLVVLQQIARVTRFIVDSYALDISWESKMRPFTDEIFVIDDLANRRHDCDVLLDQNFYRVMEHRYDGLVPLHCKLLLGPRHALLRQEFYAVKKKLRPRGGHLRRILVFYGGSDLTRETEKAIHALIRLALPSVDVDVIVGGSNSRQSDIAELCSQYDFLHYYLQVDNIAEFMAKADLCLGAGGTKTWERCFLGLPAIVTAIAENQFEICRDCAEAGLIYYLGKWDEVSEADIAESVKVFSQPEKLRAFQQDCRLQK